MITIRKGEERGHEDHGWLNTYHTFSFADYHDPQHMQFRTLRVINDDFVAAGRGFGSHRHQDMEIISYMLEGAMEHRDSMGNVAVIRPGDVQRMSAGTGVTHSEQNHSKTEPVHFLQIWIFPDQQRLPPAYEQKHFSPDERRGWLRLVAARDARDGAVTIHQDVDVYLGLLDPGQQASLQLRPGRHAWVHVATGAATLNGEQLKAGDGAALSEEAALSLVGGEPDTEVLVFDLA